MIGIDDRIQLNSPVTDKATSESVSGARFAETGLGATNGSCMAQASSTAGSQTFTVNLQTAIAGRTGPGPWGLLKRFTNANNNEIFRFNVTMGAIYRFQISAGTADTDVRVLLTS